MTGGPVLGAHSASTEHLRNLYFLGINPAPLPRGVAGLSRAKEEREWGSVAHTLLIRSRRGEKWGSETNDKRKMVFGAPLMGAQKNVAWD